MARAGGLLTSFVTGFAAALVVLLGAPLVIILMGMWPLQTLLVAAPLLIYASWRDAEAGRRVNRILRGCCGACGYDLFATGEPRCPECGTPCEPYGRWRVDERDALGR